MSTYEVLAGFPGWKPACQAHTRLAAKFDDHPGIRGWFWRLVHRREWQKSSVVSGAFWALQTLLIYKLSERLGHGWQVNASVSLAWDFLTYFINKSWAWHSRDVKVAASGTRNALVWVLFFGVNLGFAWLLMDQANIDMLAARGIMAGYGFAMNPVMFLIRDQIVYEDVSIKDVGARCWRAAGWIVGA